MQTNAGPHPFEDVLLAGKWFSTIPPDLRAALLSATVTLRLESGERLFSAGESSQGLYAVISGGIGIGRQDASQKETLLTVIESPSWFGEMSLFDHLPRIRDAFAACNTLLAHVPGDRLAQLLEAEPRYWQSFGQLLTSKLRLLISHTEDLALLSTAQRLAKRLVLIAENYGCWRNRSRRTVAISQEQLAMMLCISRQTTNQILKDLDRQQLIRLAYSAIEILDFAGLRAFAESEDCSHH